MEIGAVKYPFPLAVFWLAYVIGQDWLLNYKNLEGSILAIRTKVFIVFPSFFQFEELYIIIELLLFKKFVMQSIKISLDINNLNSV